MQTLRRAQAVIESAWNEDLGDAVLHWDGTDLLRVGSVGDVQSIIKHPGQGVLHVVAIPVGEWKAESQADATAVDPERFIELREQRKARRIS